MAYASAHTLLTFLGTAWGDAEEWQFGLRTNSTDLPTTAELDALNTAYSTLHATSAGQGLFSSSAKFVGVKAAIIGPDGHYPEGAQSVERFRTPLAGGGPDTAPQLTLACTLTSAVPRGRGSKGRFYLPPPSTGFLADSSGRINAAQAGILIGHLKTFVNAVNAAGVGPVTVFSNLGPSNVVTGVRLGRVIDTQRRRRGSITEEYLNLPLA